MLKNNKILLLRKILSGLVLWTILLVTLFSAFSMQVFAVTNSAVSSNYSLSYENMSHSDIYHHHSGNASTGGGCYQTPVYHVHNGDANSGGECFSPIYHSHASECYTTDTCSVLAKEYKLLYSLSIRCPQHNNAVENTYEVTYAHTDCGLPNEIKVAGETGCSRCYPPPGDYTHNYDKLVCTKTSSDIDGYSLCCSKTEGETIEHYSLNCNLDDKKYGAIYLYQQSTQWTRGPVILSGRLDDSEGQISKGGYGTLHFTTDNGSISETGSDYALAAQNGVYRMKVDVDTNIFDPNDCEVMVTVSNIDTTPPTLSDPVIGTLEEHVEANSITLSAVDLQPDGTAGSGLSDTPYSFDGGKTWQAQPLFECTQNATYTVCAKDNCNNISSTTVVIDNIEPVSPKKEDGDDGEDKDSDDEEGEKKDDEGGSGTDGGGKNSGGSGSGNGKGGNGGNGNSDTDNEDTKTDDENGDSSSDETTDGDTSDKDSSTPSGEKKLKDNSKKRDKNSIYTNPSDTNGPDGDGNGNYSKKQGITSDFTNACGAGEGDLSSSSKVSKGTDSDTDIINREVSRELPISTSTSDIDTTAGKLSVKPFYRTTTFKVASGVTGSVVAILGLAFLSLFLFSGVLVYNYDSNRYRFMGLFLIHHSARGLCINFSESFLEKRYSGNFQLKMGPFFTRRHMNEKMFIHSKSRWIPIEISRIQTIEI